MGRRQDPSTTNDTGDGGPGNVVCEIPSPDGPGGLLRATVVGPYWCHWEEQASILLSPALNISEGSHEKIHIFFRKEAAINCLNPPRTIPTHFYEFYS